MMTTHTDLNDLYYYVQVVDHGGFAPAGRALGMPKSKLSRRIALLEERLGVRLIQRSTRKFVVTEIGQTYYKHCKAMLIQAEAAEESVMQTHSEPCGVVRVTCPVALLEASVAKMVAEFMVKFPRVEVHLEETNRRVDVIGEGVDVAIRVRRPPLENSDLVLKVLAERRQCLVASPKLLNGKAPQIPADLFGLPSLALSTPQQDYAWQLVNEDGTRADIRHSPRLVTRHMPTLRIAAVEGVGVVQLPYMMMQGEIEKGLLVPVIKGWEPPAELIHAVFPSRRYLMPAVRALVDYLAERFHNVVDE